MNTFSRRSFLKGILSTAIALQIPIEVIEQVGKAIETLPDTPITPKNPTCYLKINDLIVPVGYIEFSRDLGDIVPIYPPIFGKFEPIKYIRNNEDKNCSLDFSTTKDYFRNYKNEKIKFEIVSDKLPFKLSGFGYFTSLTYKGGIISSDEFEKGFLYHYNVNDWLEGDNR